MINQEDNCRIRIVYLVLFLWKSFVFSHLFSSYLVHWKLKNISNLSKSPSWFSGWNLLFDVTHSHKLTLVFFSPSIIPRWVPRMNQMNFHEMQEKKEKAISLPPNSEQCHKQLNESSSNEFQLKDIFSERSQVHWHLRQVKVETFGKSTQRTLTPRHAAQIVECSQFWVRASFYWGLISLSASQLSIFTFFVFLFLKTTHKKTFLFNWGLAAQKNKYCNNGLRH